MIANRPIIVIGAGGHAKVLISSLKALQHEIVGITEANRKKLGGYISGIPIIGNDEAILQHKPDSIGLVNGKGSVSSTLKRKDIYEKFRNDGYSFVSVFHPTATILDDVHLGAGFQIMAGAIVQTGCEIGDNVIINTGVIIDHDCIIGNHVHVGPGAVLSGGVQIGEMVHIGTASTVIQGIKIGDGAIIGAGAVVIKDIPANVLAAGVPAKLIEKRK